MARTAQRLSRMGRGHSPAETSTDYHGAVTQRLKGGSSNDFFHSFMLPGVAHSIDGPGGGEICIAGWSYGGYMTMWTITQTDRFAAAVSGAGLSNWQSNYGTNNIDTWVLPFFGASVYDDRKVYQHSSPMTFIKNVHTPTLRLGGDRDAEVPITQSYEYWNALRRHGVTTEFVVYPDEGHAFQKHEIRRM